MPNPFEKPPTPTPEKPPEKPAEGLEEKKIEIVTPIGARKRTPEEIEEYKRIREKIEREKEIKEKPPEEILEERRNEYVAVDKEGRETLGKMKKKELKALEKTIEPARELIQAGDSEKLKSENEKEKRETEERKSKFIE